MIFFTLRKTLVLFILCSFIGLIDAQTIYVKHDAAGSQDGSSWANAYTDLAVAIDSAQAGNEIWIAAGTYKPGGATPDTSSSYYLKNNVTVYGGFAGTEAALTERDYETNITILNGDLGGDDIVGNFDDNRRDNVKHVFVLDTITDNTAVIDGVTISGGNAYNSAEGGNARRGGGMLAYGACTVRNCTFTDNFGWFGGGMYPRFGDASGTIIENTKFLNNGAGAGGALYVNSLDTISFKDCVFEGNESENTGGGVYNQASNASYQSCLFKSNTCGVDNRGGAIYNTGSNLVITDTDFESNTATRTGGAMSSTGDGIRVVIQDCNFTGNRSRWGGALTNYGDQSNFEISNCSFTRNNATQAGGAMSNGFKAIVNLKDCDFLNNEAVDDLGEDGIGGVIFNQNDTTTLIANDCRFDNNFAPDNGGAFFTGGNTPTTFNNCVFENNRSEIGGAIAFQADSSEIAPLIVTNCSLSFNIAQNQGGAINIGNGNTTIVNCLFDTNIANGSGTGGSISNNASANQNSPLSVMNSTFAGNFGILSAGIAQWTDTVNSTAVLTLQNNIFANEDGPNYAIEDGTPTVQSNGGNLSSDNTLMGDLTGTNDLNDADPLFADPFNSDYHLLATSPCVNKGISANAPLFDIEGNARVDSVDMGAFESPFTVGTIQLVDNSVLQLSPNPAHNETWLTLDNEWTGSLQLQLSNTLGQVVQINTLNKWNSNVRYQLDLRSLNPGLYQLSITDGKQMVSKKLLVK